MELPIKFFGRICEKINGMDTANACVHRAKHWHLAPQGPLASRLAVSSREAGGGEEGFRIHCRSTKEGVGSPFL